MDRSNRFWLTIVAAALGWMSLVAAGVVRAANSPPIASAWTISSSGSADSSGELLFRVTPPGEEDPVEITVFVASGASETAVAGSIRRALSNRLDTSRYAVVVGEGAHVVVSHPRGGPGFGLELIDSDVDDLRVSVRSIAPAVPPTVHPQNAPGNQPAVPTPPAPGEAVDESPTRPDVTPPEKPADGVAVEAERKPAVTPPPPPR